MLVVDDVSSKIILATNHVAQLIDCSFIIPEPPALKDVIEFPPGQFLKDIDQSVSSFLNALATSHTTG